MPEHTPAPTPSRAVYGFVLFLFFKTFFLLYIGWAVIPESLFRSWNITYLPQRYWAVAIPIFLLTVLGTFAFFIYPAINKCMTPSIGDIRTVEDKSSKCVQSGDSALKLWENDDDGEKQCSCKDKSKCYRDFYMANHTNVQHRSVPVAKDLDISEVSKLLYFSK